jgi:hypothetical protein
MMHIFDDAYVTKAYREEKVSIHISKDDDGELFLELDELFMDGSHIEFYMTKNDVKRLIVALMRTL